MDPEGASRNSVREWGWPLAAGIAIGAIVMTAILVPTIGRRTAASRPSPTASAGTSSSPSPSSTDAHAATCADPTGDEAPTLSLAAFNARMIGKWQLCSAKSMFNTQDPGIEFTADHHWYYLEGNSPAEFIRADGFNNEGTWNAFDRSSPRQFAPWQFNMKIAGSGTAFTDITFATKSPKVRIDNMGNVGDYVKVGGTTVPPIWPDLTPQGFSRRVGTQAGFSIDLPKGWKGGWFEGTWDYEPKGLPSTSEGGNTFAVSMTVEAGSYKSAFPGAKSTSITIEGRDAISTSRDSTHTSYAVDWQICPNYAKRCAAAESNRRLIIRLFASTAALWTQYQALGNQAALTVRQYDGSDPVYGSVKGATKVNQYGNAIARFMDARVEGVGAEDLMCCSAPNNYTSKGGVYDQNGPSVASWEAEYISGNATSSTFGVTVHYANGKTRLERVTVSYAGGNASTPGAPKISSASIG